jgi:hypothetical protein
MACLIPSIHGRDEGLDAARRSETGSNNNARSAAKKRFRFFSNDVVTVNSRLSDWEDEDCSFNGDEMPLKRFMNRQSFITKTKGGSKKSDYIELLPDQTRSDDFDVNVWLTPGDKEAEPPHQPLPRVGTIDTENDIATKTCVLAPQLPKCFSQLSKYQTAETTNTEDWDSHASVSHASVETIKTGTLKHDHGSSTKACVLAPHLRLSQLREYKNASSSQDYSQVTIETNAGMGRVPNSNEYLEYLERYPNNNWSMNSSRVSF